MIAFEAISDPSDLQDYFRYVGYEYCRLDGNTSGESRENQMDEFNAEGSTKFAFLLSTRAGGLGITLTAADIVSVLHGYYFFTCDVSKI